MFFQNFNNWIDSGFSNYKFTSDGEVHRLVTRLAIENILHPFQPWILGQKNFPTKFAIMTKIPLIVFSLEMSRQQIIYRFLASNANINSNRLKSGKMTLTEWKKVSKSMKEFSELPIFIDDNPNLGLNDIRSRLQKILTDKNDLQSVIPSNTLLSLIERGKNDAHLFFPMR